MSHMLGQLLRECVFELDQRIVEQLTLLRLRVIFSFTLVVNIDQTRIVYILTYHLWKEMGK